MLLMLPFYDNQNLVSCSDWSNARLRVDRFAVLSTVWHSCHALAVREKIS